MIFQIRPVAKAIGSCGEKASLLLCCRSKIGLYTPLASRLAASPVQATIVLARDYHSYKLTKHMEFFTASDVPIPKDTIQVAKTLSTKDRPLTLLFCWLMAKDRHIRKYADFYNRQGIDVLGVKVSPFEVLRPTKGIQVVAGEILDFLHANPSHSPMLIHGLSVGAYMFGEVMVKMKKDMDKHGVLLDRFVGQIWDSGVDLQSIPEGLPTSITSHEGLRASMRKYLEWYMRLKYKTATVHYENASYLIHQNFINTPTLVMFSDKDPISTPAMNAVIYQKWEAKNIPVYTKCFEGSPHVSHYMMHRKAYEETVLAFMEKVGMVEPAVQEASSV
ncbi:uncharacterized protein [Palaemon carinicauda]|uniref:uncharacterized protein n=1 Tax=Palaemon carinicauda TaxID=392227 RepID=UPI0035B5DE89